jgi:hypothetical protein
MLLGHTPGTQRTSEGTVIRTTIRPITELLIRHTVAIATPYRVHHWTNVRGTQVLVDTAGVVRTQHKSNGTVGAHGGTLPNTLFAGEVRAQHRLEGRRTGRQDFMAQFT